TKGLLVWQFMIESVFITLISLLIAILLVELLLPFFNNMLQVNLRVGYFTRWYVIPGLILLTILIGFFSGSYPAWFLSSFMPVKVLYGKFRQGVSNVWVRSMLVIFQFTISIILIISSFVIYRQIHYMVSKDLGFDKEQLLVIRRADGIRKQIIPFKEELRKIPNVINCANSTAVPGYPNNNNGFQIEGRSNEETYLMHVNWVDYDYLSTYRISLAEGRAFDRNFGVDSAGIIINQEAVRRFNLKEPFNTRFIQPGYTVDEKTYLNVLGICNDFHFQSLRQEIEPHVFVLKPASWDWAGYLTIRLNRENIAQTVGQIEKLWRSFTNDEPFQYFFLDQEFETFYKEERRTAKIAVAFSILAIFIASLGLFGLTSFATEQRAREISLRKVMGSSVTGIIALFSREFSLLIVLATIPAWVIAYLAMNKWLQHFEYHIAPNAWDFVLSMVIVLLIAFLTVSYRTYKAAQSNPAEMLKYE
ncbi:MAG: FtsX-like permease family protein, partial [Bacteroidales bacterium]|nr:FtsX-like permease family protein [Bacteroidales bacterium]